MDILQSLWNTCSPLHAVDEASAYFSKPAKLDVLGSQNSLRSLFERKTYFTKLPLFKTQVDYASKFAEYSLFHIKVSVELFQGSWVSRLYVQRNSNLLPKFNPLPSSKPSRTEHLHRAFTEMGSSLFPYKASHLISKKKQLS